MRASATEGDQPLLYLTLRMENLYVCCLHDEVGGGRWGGGWWPVPKSLSLLMKAIDCLHWSETVWWPPLPMSLDGAVRFSVRPCEQVDVLSTETQALINAAPCAGLLPPLRLLRQVWRYADDAMCWPKYTTCSQQTAPAGAIVVAPPFSLSSFCKPSAFSFFSFLSLNKTTVFFFLSLYCPAFSSLCSRSPASIVVLFPFFGLGSAASDTFGVRCVVDVVRNPKTDAQSCSANLMQVPTTQSRTCAEKASQAKQPTFDQLQNTTLTTTLPECALTLLNWHTNVPNYPFIIQC